MNRTEDPSAWLFLFACSYALLHILPPLWNVDVFYRLTSGDLVGFLTPFVVLTVVWKLYLKLQHRRISAMDPSFFILLIASLLYADGHGMNLAANAIARHLHGMTDFPLFRLTYFFDETIGHLFWHIGVVGITLALISASSGLSSSPREFWITFGALLFGFTYFTDAVEGQTTFILLPVALVMVIFFLMESYRRSHALRRNAVRKFFLRGYAFALIFFLIWGIWRRGFPQFSELGWIQ